MNGNILEELTKLSIIADDAEFSLYTLPSDDVLRKYQDEIGISFTEETKIYFKNLPYLSYNGFEPLLLTGDPDEYLDLLRAVRDGREMGLPTDWLPLVEDNADGYTDEEWENIATWVREVWIGGN